MRLPLIELQWCVPIVANVPFSPMPSWSSSTGQGTPRSSITEEEEEEIHLQREEFLSMSVAFQVQIEKNGGEKMSTKVRCGRQDQDGD